MLRLEIVGTVESIPWLLSDTALALELFVARDQTLKS